MEYQIDLKVYGQKYDLKIQEDDFSLYLYKNIIEDFKINDNNSRLVMLRAYVKSVYSLYQQQKRVERIIDKIEEL